MRGTDGHGRPGQPAPGVWTFSVFLSFTSGTESPSAAQTDLELTL